MPRVGNKKFGYNPAGRLAAQKESRRTGVPIQNTGGYRNQNMGRKPFPITGPRRPGQLQNPGARLVPGRPGPGIAPPRGGLRGQNMGRKPFPVTGPRRPGQLQNPGGNFAPPRRPGPGIAPPPDGLKGGGMRKPGSGGSRLMRNPGLSPGGGSGNSPDWKRQRDRKKKKKPGPFRRWFT